MGLRGIRRFPSMSLGVRSSMLSTKKRSDSARTAIPRKRVLYAGPNGGLYIRGKHGKKIYLTKTK
jgi:hypothetical protein